MGPPGFNTHPFFLKEKVAPGQKEPEKELMGPPGFEPRSTTPKAAILPG